MHPDGDRVDLRRAPVALELHLRERILQRGVDILAPGEQVVELVERLRKRLLRLDRGLHRLRGGVHAEEAFAPDQFPRLLVRHQRLGDLPARELVERIELGRGVLGEVDELVRILLCDDAQLYKRLAHGVHPLHAIRGDGVARRVEEQHVQLLDDAPGVGLHRLRLGVGPEVRRLLRLVRVGCARDIRLNRGPEIHVYRVESA